LNLPSDLEKPPHLRLQAFHHTLDRLLAGRFVTRPRPIALLVRSRNFRPRRRLGRIDSSGLRFLHCGSIAPRHRLVVSPNDWPSLFLQRHRNEKRLVNVSGLTIGQPDANPRSLGRLDPDGVPLLQHIEGGILSARTTSDVQAIGAMNDGLAGSYRYLR
jgi:hypothetical protein